MAACVAIDLRDEKSYCTVIFAVRAVNTVVGASHAPPGVNAWL